MGRMGAPATRRRRLNAPRANACAALSLTLLVLPVGCGSTARTPQDSLQALRNILSKKIPQGWQVSAAREVSFPLDEKIRPGDLVVWRTDKARLLARPPSIVPQPNPGTLYFAVSLREFIPPEQYGQRWRENEQIRKEHERVLHSVAMVPRNEKGELMPRGTVEELDVARFKREHAKLPPYQPDMPTHYFGSIALRLRDYRTVLLPENREHQQEMNQVYVALCTAMREYKP